MRRASCYDASMPNASSKQSEAFEATRITTRCVVCRICAFRARDVLRCEFGGPYLGYDDESTRDDTMTDRLGNQPTTTEAGNE